MKISNLSMIYSYTISKMLSDYFKKTNKRLGFDLYDSNHITISRHVDIRMISSDVYYIGLVDDENNLIGFVNYCENYLRHEFNIWSMVGDMTLDQKNILAKYCLKQYIQTGFEYITLENKDMEQDVIDIFTILCGKNIIHNHILV